MSDGRLPTALTGAWLVTRRHQIAWRRSWPAALLPSLVLPPLLLLALGEGLGRLVADLDGLAYPIFLAPGLIVAAATTAAAAAALLGIGGRLDTGKLYGWLRSTPLETDGLVLGELLSAALPGLLAAGSAGLTAGLLGLLPWPRSGWLLFLCPAGALLGSILGLLAAATTSRRATRLALLAVLGTPGLLFCGALFPLSLLPNWARLLAWLNPLTTAVALSQNLLAVTREGSRVLTATGLLLTLGIGGLLAAWRLRRRLDHLASARHGPLEHSAQNPKRARAV